MRIFLEELDVQFEATDFRREIPDVMEMVTGKRELLTHLFHPFLGNPIGGWLGNGFVEEAGGIHGTRTPRA